MVAVLMASFTSNAQLKTWTWSQHGLSFKAPSDAQVTENSSEVFTAQSADIMITIQLVDYTGVSMEELGTILGTMAAESGMEAGSDIGELQLTTMAGAYVEGTVQGANVIYVLLADEESNIALFAGVVYADGQEKKATDIVNSFVMK